MDAGAVVELRTRGPFGDKARELGVWGVWGVWGEGRIWFQARCTILTGFNNNICCLGGNGNRSLLRNERRLF